MLLSIETIEDLLRSEFRTQVVDRGVQNPIRFLRRWSFLSSQVTRLHGAALARVKIPDIQRLLSEIAYGECGFGNSDKIHSKLLTNLIAHSPDYGAIALGVEPELQQFFEATVDDLCQMEQDEAVGFIVGLEAPAYDILKLLKQALAAVDIPEATILQSEYMVIHDLVEKEHQDSGHAAMQIILDSGCNLRKIHQGGDCAIQFLIRMVGETDQTANLFLDCA